MGRTKTRMLLSVLPYPVILLLTLTFVLGSIMSAQGVDDEPQVIATESPFGSAESGEYCYTQIEWARKMAAQDKDAQACSPLGECDNPFTRDSWIPGEEQPITVLRLFFHILRNTDGSNPVTTPTMVAQQVTHLNQDYLPYRIQFEYDWQYVNNSAYRYLDDNEMNAMKNAYAIAPDSQLNIFVSVVNESYSFGTFPWDSDAQTKTGGIVMTQGHFTSVQSVLAHEIGHCLGLWHTHHGVSEVSQCSACYERADGFEGDYRGDLCSDTDPTPTNYSCSGPGGVDPCTGLAWGDTDTQNFMGYGPDFCITEFSPQQAGRMGCWIDSELSSWVQGVRFTASNTFGPAPLEVVFDGITTKTVNQWAWDFGDGGTGDVADPTYTYSIPGTYTVSVDINATDGVYGAERKDLVMAYADTADAADVVASPGESVRIDIYARNYVPLRTLEIPFSWSGELNVKLDSLSTAGLRTDWIPQKSFIHYNGNFKQATYFINPGNDILNPELAPGTGPVLSVYFSVPEESTGGTNPITLGSYDTYNLEFTTSQGAYTPVTYSGSIELCKAGDVNSDGTGPDVSDLTYLVAFLFLEGPPPPVPATANMNGDVDIDISDLTFLVNFLFLAGPGPTCN